MLNMEREVGQMIIEVLNLENIIAEDIHPDAPLFSDGLGLDSIDALELSLAISQRYGAQIRAENNDVNQIFSSVRSLTKYIESNRQN